MAQPTVEQIAAKTTEEQFVGWMASQDICQCEPRYSQPTINHNVRLKIAHSLSTITR